MFSPVSDLGDLGDSLLCNAGQDPTLSPGRIPEVEEAYVAGADTTNPEVSPIYGKFDADFPPTFITSGTRDLLLSSCVRLARVMHDAGASVDLRIWERMWHVFEFYSEIPESDASLSEISVFLDRFFKQS